MSSSGDSPRAPGVHPSVQVHLLVVERPVQLAAAVLCQPLERPRQLTGCFRYRPAGQPAPSVPIALQAESATLSASQRRNLEARPDELEAWQVADLLIVIDS